MTAHTPAPNEDTPRQPQDQDAGRNDPAIDPDGNKEVGTGTQSDDADGNSYSPDIAPESEAERNRRLQQEETDADIDTDGG